MPLLEATDGFNQLWSTPRKSDDTEAAEPSTESIVPDQIVKTVISWNHIWRFQPQNCKPNCWLSFQLAGCGDMCATSAPQRTRHSRGAVEHATGFKEQHPQMVVVRGSHHGDQQVHQGMPQLHGWSGASSQMGKVLGVGVYCCCVSWVLMALNISVLRAINIVLETNLQSMTIQYISWSFLHEMHCSTSWPARAWRFSCTL